MSHTAAPGSRLEHQASAAVAAAPDQAAVELETAAAAGPGGELVPVPVERVAPPRAAYNTYLVTAGNIQQLAGRNARRARLTLHLVTNGAFVCGSKEIAQSIAANSAAGPFPCPGFWYAAGAGSPPVVIENQEEIWLANPGGGGTSAASIFVEWCD